MTCGQSRGDPIALTHGIVQSSYRATFQRGIPGVAMSDAPDPERLKKLEERIAELKKAREPKDSPHEEHFSAASQGWRMVIELVAGLGIGFGIGYGLDVLLGTIPLFLVLFTLLGFVAGVKTMLRTAQELGAKDAAAKAAGNTAGAKASEGEGE